MSRLNFDIKHGLYLLFLDAYASLGFTVTYKDEIRRWAISCFVTIFGIVWVSFGVALG